MPQTSVRSRPRDLKSINDNYCVSKMEGLNPSPVTLESETVGFHVNSLVVNVPFVTGSPQKKGVNPNSC